MDVRFLSDDGESELRIFSAPNGDWYISTHKPGERVHDHCVRVRTSGGAAFRCPGLPVAVANAARAIQAGDEAGTLHSNGFAA